jgi:SAM-dependent methyltransferase
MPTSAWQPHVEAMLAYHRGDAMARIVVHDDYGDCEAHDIAHFFRTEDQFPRLEQKAIDLCRGRVLDVGAGSGCHSLILQQRGLDVCALELAPELCDIMRDRGVLDVRCSDIGDFEADQFDTILMMMNGLELAGSLSGLERLLHHLHTLVAADGQVLADSTDLRPTHGSEADPTKREDGRYVGELTFQLEYEDIKGTPFQHLYVDPDTLNEYADAAGWNLTVVHEADFGHYLAQLAH